MAARRRAMMAKPAMNPTMMKKGGKADDMGQDKAMIKKAFKQHDAQEHKVGSTKLKLKHGGKFATGGVVNGQGGFAKGGIIKSTKGETKMVTAKVDKSPASTGGVKLGNGGGYKTGGVAKANAGGYMEGGSAKKAYATGGTVDTGKPVAMPKKPASKPVANSMQSGTFAKGGKVGKFAEGDVVDASKGAYDKSIGPSKEDMDMAKAIRSIPSKLFQGAKSMMGMTPKPAGSVTKTEKSVTVSPASKKRGGGC
jgi:hypothetical protein